MKKALLLTTAITMMAFNAQAKMFELHLVQGTIDETRGFDSVMDIFDYYQDGGFDSIFSGYVDDSTVTNFTLNFRGIDLTLDYAANNDLTFSIPSLGITKNFGDGTGTQKSNFKELKDWLKDNKDGLLTKILKSTVADTPYDMVAGNPNSLMANMADNSFQRGGGGVLGNFLSYVSPNASTHHFKLNGDSKKATVYSLPMGKTFKFDNGSKLMFDMPL